MSKSPFFSVGHLPRKPKSSQYRLRFKNHKALGVRPEGVFGSVHHFPSKKEAEEFGQSKVDEARIVGMSARGLCPQTKEAVLTIAAALEKEGYDPVSAIQEGAKLLKTWGHTEKKLLSEFWDAYFTTNSARVWCEKEILNQKAFRRNTADTFFCHPLKDFMSKQKSRAIIKQTVKSYMRGNRKARNTAKLLLAKMASFLRYVSSESDHLAESHIRDMFNGSEHLLPANLKPEAVNIKFTPEQCLHVIRGMAAKGYAAYIVFKLFMGARTLQLHRWAWEIVDWGGNKIFIPNKQTKNKKGNVSFAFEEISHFKAWIEWAYELEGKPDAKQKIVSHSQPTVNRSLTAIFNSNRSLFKFCHGNTPISGSAHARNICRSTFISYGIEALGGAITSRIAEDHYNLDKYIDRGNQGTSGSDAKAFFDLHPRDLNMVNS
jgi:integrase